jgi:hypothetical protein
MEVLFSLLAERYDRGSVLILSNLPFSTLSTALGNRYAIPTFPQGRLLLQSRPEKILDALNR